MRRKRWRLAGKRPHASCLFFNLDPRDFYCGLRGFSREAINRLGLKTTGMEFASEMLVRAGLAKFKITSVPTHLAKDGRSRPPHLRTWRDGWRHLRLLLLFSPRWLFICPGLAMIAVGLGLGFAVLPGPVHIRSQITLDVHTLIVACISILVGTQAITFGVFARRYASFRGFLPADEHSWLIKGITLERMLSWRGLAALRTGGGCLGVIDMAFSEFQAAQLFVRYAVDDRFDDTNWFGRPNLSVGVSLQLSSIWNPRIAFSDNSFRGSLLGGGRIDAG
jgi:hypothetical protein